MTGTMRERKPGTWELRVATGKRATGKYGQTSRTFRGTKAAAGRALRQFVAEVEASQGTERLREGNVAHVLERWMRHLETLGRSPTTLRTHRSYLRLHILPALGGLPLRNLRPADLNDLYGQLRASGLSSSTVHQTHAIVHAGLEFAVREGWLAANPAARAEAPAARRRELAPPSLEQLAELICDADGHDPEFGVFLRLAAATGMRRGELCGLRWGDVDLDAGVLTIARAAIETGEIKETKTRRVRRNSLDPSTLSSLRAHRARLKARAEEAMVAYAGEAAFLFSPEPSGRVNRCPGWASSAFARARGRCGLPHVRLHDLRHAHATLLLAAGVPLKTVGGRLGHAQTSTTLNIYAHALAAGDRDAADMWGRISG